MPVKDPTREFVITAVRRWLAAEPAEHYIPAAVAPERLRALASANRLWPLMHLSSVFAHPSLPDEWRVIGKAAEAAYQVNTLRALRGLALAGELNRRWTKNGIVSLALRGPFAGLDLYGDVAGRHFTDLDLLVPRAQRHAALQVGRLTGWNLPRTGMPAWFFARQHLHWRLVRADCDIPCELHWALDHPVDLQKVAYAELFRRAVPFRDENFAWRQPCPAHLLLTACMHLAKHVRVAEAVADRDDFLDVVLENGWLGHWLDVALILRKHGATMDWSDVAATASAWRIEHALASGIVGARYLLGAGFPPALPAGLCRAPQSVRSAELFPAPARVERPGRATMLAARGGFRVERFRDLGRYLAPEAEFFAPARGVALAIRRGRHALQAAAKLAVSAMDFAAGSLWAVVCRRRCILPAVLAASLIAAPARAHNFGDDHADTPAAATPVSVGVPMTGRIEIDIDRDWFSFQVETFKRYAVTVSRGTLWDATLAIQAGDAAVTAPFADSVGAAAARIDCIAITDGTTVRIGVGGFAEFTTGTYTIVISQVALVDTDGDGMPDGWENLRGLNPLDATGSQGARGDPDGDGIINVQEYLLGTSPRFRQAGNDNYALDEDIPLTVPPPGVKTNDEQFGAATTVRLVTAPQHGNLTLQGSGGFTYQPYPDYFGTDRFKYTLFDGAFVSQTATVTLAVNPVNDAPRALTAGWRVQRNKAGAIVLTGYDVEGSPLTYRVISRPLHGILTGGGADWVYVPASNYWGHDSFLFQVNDGRLDSPPAAIALTVFRPWLINDFNGDGRSDPVVFNPQNATWFILAGGNSLTRQWGFSDVVTTSADCDGDSRADLGVFDPASMRWYIETVNGVILVWNWLWGKSGATSITGDFDGDGAADLAVWDSATGSWFIYSLSRNRVLLWNFRWGWSGARIRTGDYDGDNCDDLAVWDPHSACWFIYSPPRRAIIAWNIGWGLSGGELVNGDYDGDGIADLGVFDPETARWYVYSLARQRIVFWGVNWGFAGVRPVPGDYDGDGITDLAVYYPPTGEWYIRRSRSGKMRIVTWGFMNAVPVAP